MNKPGFWNYEEIPWNLGVCVCVCMWMCVHVCAYVCVSIQLICEQVISLDYLFYFYFPDKWWSIPHSKSSPLTSTVSPVLGANWLLSTSNSLLILNISMNIEAISFCLFTSAEYKFSYSNFFSNNFLLFSFLIITLHFSRCYWSWIPVLHRSQKRSSSLYLFLKFDLQLVVFDCSVWCWFTSSFKDVGLSIYFWVSSCLYSIFFTFECFDCFVFKYLKAAAFVHFLM